MGRLFWKIFFWFWVALVLLNLSVGWGVKIYYDQIKEIDDRVLQAKVETIAEAFRSDNRSRARLLLKQAYKEYGTPIFVLNDRGEDFLGRPLPHFLRSEGTNTKHNQRHQSYRVDVTLPDGKQIKLVALYRPSWLREYRLTPIWLGLVISLIISTLVCYALAKYLASPVQRLSSATRKLAEGNLDVRVGNIQRRDEIADLALDFDRMADKIQQLLGSQRQLLQDISHELRSPLARLQVALALVRRSDNEHQVEYDRIARNLDRLEELIGEVLTLSRLDTVTYTKERFDLAELASAIVRDCQLEVSAKSCTLHTDIAPALMIDGSPELLRRAVENVLRNAIKFSQEGSEVSIVAAAQNHHISIRVNDQGPGIPEESKDSVFEAFVRIDQARQHKPGGYGLGLAIAKKAIELHGGTIAAENRPEGGLSVVMHLPI